MTDELFSELVESVREGGAILWGEAEPSRAFEAGDGRPPQLTSRALAWVEERGAPKR